MNKYDGIVIWSVMYYFVRGKHSYVRPVTIIKHDLKVEITIFLQYAAVIPIREYHHLMKSI